MLSCETSYEFYLTSEFSLDWHLQEDNGSIDHGVLAAKQSDESEHPGAIIFMDTKQADVPVVWRVENVDGEIVKTAIVLINTQFPCERETGRPSSSKSLIRKCDNVPMDLWVFDTIVVVKMEDGTFAFYEKPMVLGMNKDPLVGNIISENTIMPYNFQFSTYALAACCEDGDSFEFFGVTDVPDS